MVSGYTDLEYIQSSGKQYINTQFVPNSNTRVVADLQIVEIDKSIAANAFWGARTNSESKGYGFQYNCNVSQLQHFYGGYTLFNANSALYTRQIWEQNKNVLSGTGVSHTADAITFQCEYNLYLFALNDANVVKFNGRAKLYSCKIYDNGVLVRDFVPKMRVSDSVVGLYDLVNDVFYTNAGSGTFSYGLPPVTYNNSVLINGTKYHITGGTSISEFSVGSSIYLNVNGVPKEFLIVHKGNPNASLYDASCDGVWLLMKDIYTKMDWQVDSSSIGSNYDSSPIHSYLNGQFINLFDPEIVGYIKTVKIPFYKAAYPTSSVYSGSNGLSTKAFLLSGREVSLSGLSYLPNDGACLSYFEGIVNKDRIANFNGSAYNWWLRSISTDGTLNAWNITETGGGRYNGGTLQYGIRPALIMPYEVLVDRNNIITMNGSIGIGLVDGTGYDILKGKTMINRTIYDI